jgi:ABC-type sugar transport system substrate-binding protein
MRKVIVIFLSLLLATAVMAGCQPSAPAQTEAPASQAPAESVEATAAPTQAAETSAATEEKSTEGMKIAYFVSTLANEFHQARADAAVKYAKEKYGAEVTIIDGKSDANVMTQNVDMLATSDFDGATLQIWEAEAAKPGVEAAIEQGIAVTSFFSPLGDTGIPTYRSDEAGGSFQMGADAAKQWVAANPDKKIVTVQLGWPDNREVKTGRTDPFVKGIESVVGAGNFTDLGCMECSGGADATKEALSNILVTNPEVNIIYSEAGDLTPGAMSALKDAGRGTMNNGKPTTEIVCSVDCPVSEMKDIFNPSSSLKASLGLPPIGTSEAIIDLIVSVYQGKVAPVSNPAEEVFGPVQVVDAWNMTVDDALAWYNAQFGTSLTKADVS